MATKTKTRIVGKPGPWNAGPGIDVLARKYADTVEKRTDKTCPLLFHRGGKPIVRLSGTWIAACETAKVLGRLRQDLRRTAIGNLVRAGVTEAVAMKMCGHKTRSVFDRYNISDQKDLKAAAALLGVHHRDRAKQAKRS